MVNYLLTSIYSRTPVAETLRDKIANYKLLLHFNSVKNVCNQQVNIIILMKTLQALKSGTV
jgi:hypothetical protein